MRLVACARSGHRIAVGGLAAAEARGPHAPALGRRVGIVGALHRSRHGRRARCPCRVAVRSIGVGGRSFGEFRRACARIDRVAASGDERIGHHAHELCHRVERGLLCRGGSLAGDLRQSRRGQTRQTPAECRRCG